MRLIDSGPNEPGGRDPQQCPFHMYRSSTDIAPCWGSILANLQTVTPLADAGLSYPGCWAYPGTPDCAPMMLYLHRQTCWRLRRPIHRAKCRC